MVTIRITTAPARKRPKAGDRRVTKKHGLQIRVHDMACVPGSWPRAARGRLYNNGRPCFTWVCPQDLEPWDRHHLTPEELAEYFPPGPPHGCGHMQGRGAA